MFNDAFKVLDKIESKTTKKERIITRISSFFLALFFIFPFILMTIQLLEIFYELEIFLVIFLWILAFILTLLFTKFCFDVYKKKADLTKEDIIYKVYILNLLYPLIIGAVVFIIYLIMR